MRKIRPRRPKPAVIAHGSELRDGRQFKLLVLEPATRDGNYPFEGEAAEDFLAESLSCRTERASA